MKNRTEVKGEKYDTILFWAVCILLSVLQYFYGLQHFYFDAERYWESGRELKVDGVFSLSNHVTQRGILFPLFNYALIEFLGYLNWHEISFFKCISTVFCTWGFWYLLPQLYVKTTGKTLGVWHKMALVAITNLFWFRYFSCPLSDFLCFFLLLWGFLLLWPEHVSPAFSRTSLLRIMLVGLICGFIFNTRPIYVLLLAMYPLFYAIISRNKWSAKLAHIALLLFFAMAINIPQYIVNQKVWKADTFFQPTDKYYEGKSLYLMQLKWGLYVQKYETYVGDSACYRAVPAFYYHNRLTAVSVEQPVVQQIETYGQYIQYLIAHPVCIVWFAKNVFNGLDIQYNTPYVYHLKPNLWFTILNYAIWFIGFVLIGLCWRSWAASKGFLIILGYLLFTAVLSIPTAIESRFLLALYCIIYLVVVSQFHLLIPYWKNSSGTQKIVLAGSGLVFIGCCIYLSQSTFAQLQYEVLC